MKKSAGILLFRRTKTDVEFFLVHPGGPFFRNKDDGAWTIPKGEYDDDEDAFDAAKREFFEETGNIAEGREIPLTPVRLKSGKRVSAWAIEGDIDAGAIRSNNFTLEWPPRSGKTATFPEVDRAGWFSYEEAMLKINPAQKAFLSEVFSVIRER